MTETEPGVRWTATQGDHEARAFLGRLHRTHAWLSVAEDVPAEVVGELADALADHAGVPLAAKAVPGSPRHEQLTEAGGTAYQVCPPSEVDGTEEANAAWAAGAEPEGAVVRPLTGMAEDDVLELWVRLYSWVHARWSPVEDDAVARALFGPMLAEDLDRDLSAVTSREGRPTAVAFALQEPEGMLCVVAEAVEPDAATAREDVAAVMRAVVRSTAAAGRPMFFDGHESDPHYPAVLATVPRVTGDGLHLIQLPGDTVR